MNFLRSSQSDHEDFQWDRKGLGHTHTVAGVLLEGSLWLHQERQHPEQIHLTLSCSVETTQNQKVEFWPQGIQRLQWGRTSYRKKSLSKIDYWGGTGIRQGISTDSAFHASVQKVSLSHRLLGRHNMPLAVWFYLLCFILNKNLLPHQKNNGINTQYKLL